MYVVVGLGNPGRKYEHTRHNVGFDIVDVLAQRNNITLARLRCKAVVGEGTIAGQRVALALPQTYMNLSGESVREILSFYKEDPKHLIVIYDDIDIPMGTLRIRKKGSAGTHNGMRSILYQIGSENFPRVRIGIGGERRGDLADYVISGFSKEDREKIENAILRAADATACIVEKGIEAAMGEYNSKAKAAKKAEEENR